MGPAHCELLKPSRARVVQDYPAPSWEMPRVGEPPVRAAGSVQGALLVGKVQEGGRKPDQGEEGITLAV